MNMLLLKFGTIGAISAITLLSATAVQATTISSDFQGWVNGLGNGSGVTNNAFTGTKDGVNYNSWANFDLSGLSGTVISAKLEVYSTITPIDGSTYTVDIHDVNTTLAVLQSATPGIPAYSDLGGGSFYGSDILGNATTVTLALSGQALIDINALLGSTFRVGFSTIILNTSSSNSSDEGTTTSAQGVFTNGELPDHPKLILTFATVPEPDSATVPEPDSVALLALGFAGLSFARRRGRRS